ncbi:MAG: hypothetical protein JSS61_02970 [Verrucomicrobia bacterium]|nr:hypothetical protein [Verrucomicrobiota bacterium]
MPQDKNLKRIGSHWWMVLIVGVSSLIYVHALRQRDQVVAALDQQMQAQLKERQALFEEREDLLLQIHSQSDPAWIELTLKKGLGVVPEGQSKVFFTK